MMRLNVKMNDVVVLAFTVSIYLRTTQGVGTVLHNL